VVVIFEVMWQRQFLLVLVTLIGLAVMSPGRAADAETAYETTRLPPDNLLWFHDSRGHIKPVHSKADWSKRRKEILSGMQQVMGPLPDHKKRCALEMEVGEEIDCGGYIQRSISYASEPGSRVPAFLLLPKTVVNRKAKTETILALHPTDMEFGRRVVVETLRSHYRAYAADLATRGYVVLAPAYPLMADYQPDLRKLGYQSGTMKAIWDNIRGIDLLESLPFVKKGRIGVIGHSLGGHNAIFTAAFDDRIKAVVSSCGFDSFADYMDGRIDGWTSPRYMPGLLDYRNRLKDIPFDFYELIGALAPRPAFINAPSNDSNFKWRSVDKIVSAVQPIYQLFGVEKKLIVVHPDVGHDFPAPVREEAYRFLDEALKHRPVQ
jgi:pimeloyl-ACP methyl ester carboxylesterase